MSIPPPIPRLSVGPLKKGEVYVLSQKRWVPAPTHIAFWSLQRTLNSAGFNLREDGDFGQRTDVALRTYQASYGLDQDGVAGGASHAQFVEAFCEFADPQHKLPRKLAPVQIRGESGNWLGAVNWDVEGGVDGCVAQRRVYATSYRKPWPDYGASFYSADVERAFDALYQIKLLCTRLLERHKLYVTRPAVSTSERAWRLAVLQHNFPSGADRLSRTKEPDLSSYWTTPQRWVVDLHTHFPDGTACQTPLQHCQRYSLGNAAHNEPGQMVKGVSF